MEYKEFERIISAKRMGRYLEACGVSTRKGNRLFIHVLDCQDASLYIPLKAKVKKATQFVDGTSIAFSQDKEGVLLKFPKVPTETDYVVELLLK